jgi:hypothetical protein
MATLSYPLNVDEYIGAEIVQLWHYGRTTGVFSAEENLLVESAGGMSIKINKGAGWIKYAEFGGIVVACTTEETLTVPLASGTMDRMDVVVLYYDMIAEKVGIEIKMGTPSSQPEIPSMTRDTLRYEIGLAIITVKAGVVSLTNADILDSRLDTTFCGLVRDGVTGIPTTGLINNFNEWLAQFKKDHTDMITIWFSDKKDDFDNWFNEVRETLDGDSAGKLLNLINEIREELKSLGQDVNTINSTLDVMQDNIFRLFSEKKENIEFSFDSQVTGDKWVDGKPIYTICVKIPPGVQGGTLGEVLHTRVPIDSVEHVFFDMSNSYTIWDNLYYPLIASTTTNDNPAHRQGEMYFRKQGNDGGILELHVGARRSFGGGVVCIRYTRSDDGGDPWN